VTKLQLFVSYWCRKRNIGDGMVIELVE